MTEPRLAPLAADLWDAEARDLLKRGVLVGDGKVLNVFATLAHHPKLLKRWLVFGNHVLAKSTLNARSREILILRTGWLCGAPYEWGQHVVIGRAAGLSDSEIAAISEGPTAQSWSEPEKLLLAAADELFAHRTIGDPTYAALARSYSEQQLLDIVFTIGQYQLVSTALNTFRVQRDDGVTGVPMPDPARIDGLARPLPHLEQP